MTDPDRNAALWFARDAFDPSVGAMNGRRSAGESFLRGFLRHADVAEFVSVTRTTDDRRRFAEAVAGHRPAVPHRPVSPRDLDRLAPVGTLYYPAPNFAETCWQRQAFGIGRYSICGITHTTATKAVMRGFVDLRAGPQAEWDAIICTSHAVRAATRRNIEIADEFLHARFGTLPPAPLLPVIPLGINCDDFTPDRDLRQRLRAHMGWSEDDVVVVTLARLSPHGKFDPGPLFVALQRAQKTLGRKRRLSFVACGAYPDSHSKSVFEDCAALLMPDVPFHHVPGGAPDAVKTTLSGGDIFALPSDNVQEAFGLAPVEAMAAGLPIVASDWDGLRDTVTPETGFRVATRSVRAEATGPEAQGYLDGTLTYVRYMNRLSMLTAVEVAGMAEAFVALAKNGNLRRRMGAAARRRAMTEYDWSVVTPRLQDLWGELAAIRKAHAGRVRPTDGINPTAPLPMDLFAAYPTGWIDRDAARIRYCGGPEELGKIFTARRYAALGQPAESLVTLEKLRDSLVERGEGGATIVDLARSMRWNVLTVERSVAFFLKYGLARILS